MTLKKKFLISISIISVFVITLIDRLASFGRLFNDDTYLTAVLLLVTFTILFSFVNRKLLRGTTDSYTRFLFYLWLIILFVGFFRGVFIAENYYDWKQLLLNNLPFAFSTLFIFIGYNIMNIKFIVSNYIRYVFLFGFFLINLGFLTNDQLYPRLMVPVTFLILFIPYIKKKWGLLILIVALVSCLVSLGFRIYTIKVAISFFILVLFYINLITPKTIRLYFISLVLIPLIFLTLGFSGNFNLFDYISSQDDYSYSTVSRGEITSFNTDTRTFIYIEVLNSIDNLKELVFGNSMISDYNSEYFDSADAIGVRQSSEVGALNIFMFYGIVGIVSFLLIIFRISFLAIYRSNNLLSKMLGLLIAFWFITIFVEENTRFDLNFCFFWLIIGLLSSIHFRSLTDVSIKNYFAKL